jgi:hypothetical protein
LPFTLFRTGIDGEGQAIAGHLSFLLSWNEQIIKKGICKYKITEMKAVVLL